MAVNRLLKQLGISVVAAFLSWQALAPFIADCYLQQAQSAYNKQEVDLSLQKVKRSLSWASHSLEAIFLLGRIYQKMGVYSSSVEAYEKALGFFPYAAIVWNNLGTARFLTGDAEGAVQSLQKVVSLDPANIGAHYNLALVYEAKNERRLVEVQLEKIRELDPNFMGNVYLSKGVYDDSAAEYHRAIRRNPDNLEAHYKLGFIYEKKNSLDQAIEMYQKVLSINPEYVDARRRLAFLYHQFPRKQYDEAISQYRRCLELLPDEIDKVYERVSFYTDMNIYTQVLEEHVRISELKDMRTEIIKELAALYELRGERENAVDEYKKLLEDFPKDVQLYQRIAALYENQGKFKEAIAEYKEIVKYDPQDTEVKDKLRKIEEAQAHVALAAVYEKGGLRQRSVDEYKKASAALPENPYLYYILGWLHVQEANKPDAVGFYQKAVLLDAGFYQARVALARVFQDLDDFGHAEEQYRIILNAFPDYIQAHLGLGLLFERQNRYEEAKKEYQEVLRLDPANSEARILLDNLPK
ncbi:MAG: tetratricopeptide repeat protein [Candidatus Omnitrophica bacterium]|nr:tetratricopeptide repeat protein [Candidatus Omnitrophota bacterium]